MTEEEFNKIIENLKVDLQVYDEMIKEVSSDMIMESFTQYPIFIATEHEVKMGELILEKDDHAATFSIYATTLEEMVDRKLVLEEKKNDFIQTYKDPKKFMCVMLITATIASFVFVPYKN
jgi:hypothetical protein